MTIENMYNERIEDLKNQHEADNDPSHLRSIAVQFYEIALINESRRSIRNFYLYEAYSYMKRCESEVSFNREDLIFILRIMIHLRSLDLARSIMVQALARYPDDNELILLAAEIEYYRKNFKQVFTLFHRIGNSLDSLPEEAREICSVWTPDT